MNVLDNMNLPDVIVPQQVQLSVASANNLANNAALNNNVNNNNVKNNNNANNGNNGNNVNNVNNANNANFLASAENPVFLIVASRDLEDEEVALLNLYGKVLQYDSCHVNIPLDQLIRQNNANYLVFDVRDKNHRMAISKSSVQHENEHVHVIALVSSWEKLDDFIDDAGCENSLATLPPKQAFKNDFNTLLLEKKIRKPSCAKNILRLVLKAWGGWAKDS
jgi:hypothetical protein